MRTNKACPKYVPDEFEDSLNVAMTERDEVRAISVLIFLIILQYFLDFQLTTKFGSVKQYFFVKYYQLF